MANEIQCDIFINHRGPDVKHTIASTIYNTLDAIGLRPFLDVEVLEAGLFIPPVIEKAIISASLHIAIFSPNYAQSSWCLNELSFLLRTGTKIIPIFYHVKPSDLRWIVHGKGAYAYAFSGHEKWGRFTREKIEEWKRALHVVSFISGYEVNDNEAERRLVKSIRNEALQIKGGARVKIAKCLIRSDEYKSPLNQSEKEVLAMAAIKCIGRVEVAVDVCFDKVEESLGDCLNEVEGSLNKVERGLKSAWKWLMD
ncbi:hypothetical protein SUGI_0546540 [Cryptomeria japonica]|nr:hypothetical protein SUGI_0546540 [Cryptomeria japonica]